MTLKDAAKNFTLKFKLGQQGLMVLGLVLSFEVLFAVGFYSLLHQAEVEARNEELTKEIVSRIDRVMTASYFMGDSGEKYVQTKDEGHYADYMKQRADLVESLKWLELTLKSRPDEYDAFRRMDEVAKGAMGVVERTVSMVKADRPLQALAFVQKHQAEFNKIIKGGLPEVRKFTDLEKRLAAQSPKVQQQNRNLQRNLLFVFLAVNILFTLLLGWSFTENITGRLGRVVDNTVRLGAGEPLLPTLDGRDEIAQLDGVFHNMAQVLRQGEEELRQSEARIRSIIEKMPIGLVVARVDGKIESANPTTERMFGYTSRELLGRTLGQLFLFPGESEEDRISHLMKSLNKIQEFQGKRKGGEQFPVEFSLAEISLADGPRNLAIIIDITERYEIQRLRQAFVAMVSHELRTPLTSVRGYLNLLTMGALGEIPTDAVSGAERAEKNLVRLIGLINDLLDLERMESGNLTINTTQMSLSSVLEQSLDAVQIFAEDHDVTIEMTTSQAELSGDSDRIVQVLVNLLSNAIKFSVRGGTVKVAVQEEPDWIEIKVADRGRGIPKRFKDSIFEKFQQVEEGDAKKKGGTGLGLAICKAIVEQHGGSIGVESVEGEGSTFWFRLPKRGVKAKVEGQAV